MKRALITGISGQDGSYLAELLLTKGYEVHGLVRQVALEDPAHRLVRISHLLDRIHLHPGSLENLPGLYRIFLKTQPDECYHLAAQSFVSYSLDDEFSAITSSINGTHHLLAALKDATPACRFYFAATSEMFGRAEETPQSEKTRFHPRSAYGISKVTGYDLTRHFREACGLHASSGILYNHESPRRGFEFVTRKITRGIADILSGKAKQLMLGNLEARRDWGHAKDAVRAMWMMLQQPKPDDYVIATGETHSVRDFAELAFRIAGMEYQKYVMSDPRFVRPAEIDVLVGDASKARTLLGWSPEITFFELVKEMVMADRAESSAHEDTGPGFLAAAG